MSELALEAGPVGLAGNGRARRLPLVIAVCFGLLLIVLVMAVLGTLLTPHDPSAQNVAAAQAGPSGTNWLGTDALGRDVFSRLIAGTRTAVLGPALVAVVAMLVGSVLGLLAGYRGGWIDAIISRWIDLMLALPALLVLIVAIGALGGGYWLAIALLTLLVIPGEARIARSVTLEQTPRPYVEAAKTLGVPDRRIMLLHIWPNIAATVLAQAFLTFGTTLVALAGLSYLGLGIPPGTPNWGLMLAESQDLLFVNPAAALAPGVLIVVTATSMNLIGDWLYEQLSARGATR